MGKGQSKSYDISGEVKTRKSDKSNRNSERISKISLNGSQPVELNGTNRDSTAQEDINKVNQKSQEEPEQNQQISATDSKSDETVSNDKPESVEKEDITTKKEEKEEESKVEEESKNKEENTVEEESKSDEIVPNDKPESVEEKEDITTKEEDKEEENKVEEESKNKEENTVEEESKNEEENKVEEESKSEEVQITEESVDPVIQDTQKEAEEVEPQTSEEADVQSPEVTQPDTEAQVEDSKSPPEIIVTAEDSIVETQTEVETSEIVEVTQIASSDTVEQRSVEEEKLEDTEEMSDTVEAVVCQVEDLKDGDMKEVELGDGKVLLVREGDDIHAMGHKCTHYGAPLIKGVHCNGKVRCPWHGACFNVKTGDIEDFPGLDSIPKFEVNVDDGKVKVKAKKSVLSNHKRQKTMCQASDDTDQSLLIIGGGPASVACAETLRQEGYTGKISIATRETNLPYDRPKLSKAMDIKADAISLRPAEFYATSDINIMTNHEATKVDPENKTVTFSDGSTETYTTLLLATGGKPRVLPIPGADLKNVCQLRTPEDANFIAENAAGKNVVIIGSSFIGMEVASFLAEKAASVSVVDIIKVPFQLVLGEKVGAVLQKMHEEKGVKFYFERGIKEFTGTDGAVTEAVLSDDTRLTADLCVLGVGVVPATDFIKDSGIDMNNRGFLSVNKRMQTNQPNIFAAGDIVEFPLFSVGDRNVNIQHWQMAHAQGKAAAHGILGHEKDIKSVPYFWTVMYGKSIRYTGYGPGYDDIVVHGDLDAPKFVAYYTKDDEVVAVASLNFDPIVSQAAELMYSGKKIMKSEILESEDSWVSKL